MKVLKFGGTSVGTPDSLRQVKNIVSACKGRVIVVVSALGGVTDSLVKASGLAESGDASYKDILDGLRERHLIMCDELVGDSERRAILKDKVGALCDRLSEICGGVYMLGVLPRKAKDEILSFGERMSSLIVAEVIPGGHLYDSLQFIRTVRSGRADAADTRTSYPLIRKAFAGYAMSDDIAVVPGFISSDSASSEITNLGRGGSDYSASLIAAALDAEQLEIWTDVDGFMTADPRVIKTAYTIKELSYIEAMELCNFGAKVVYPPTIYPVCVKNIPIRVKNTFNPDGEGSIIKQKVANNDKPIKGISSINGTTLITVAGLSMVGVIGVNRRIFTALADNGISVFMVSQASSENSTSIGVRDQDAKEAVEVLNGEFAKEIETGAMYPMHAENGLATIAVVGENMKNTPGIAGKLFGTLGRAGISMIACAQGAPQTNISFVVKSEHLRKALNAIHDSFFLSEYKVLNLFVCGVGTVGGQLLEQIHNQYEELKRTKRLKLNVVGIATSKKALFNSDGIDLANYRELLADADESNESKLRDAIIEMNCFNSVFVDCTASKEVAEIYQPLLEHNISVIAANKIAASSSYEKYARLKETALARGVFFRYETNVGAGLPIIGTINDLRNSGDVILKIEAVLSGTLNFIFNEISADVTLSEAVRRAKEQGYSEPDPRIDLSGKDVIRKLVILAREAGYKVEKTDVEAHLFIPDEFFEGNIDEFWKNLPKLDADFEARRKQLDAEGKRWRFVATFDHGKLSVALKEVDRTHPFYNLQGSNNIVALTTERYREYPMLIQGYGAGASVTAAGVFANIMSIANI